MALHTMAILVCDVCAAEQRSDKLDEVLGVLIEGGQFSHKKGGGPLSKVYFCYDCARHSDLMALVKAVKQPEPAVRKPRSRRTALTNLPAPSSTPRGYRVLQEVSGGA